jgi:hypothetical protein
MFNISNMLDTPFEDVDRVGRSNINRCINNVSILRERHTLCREVGRKKGASPATSKKMGVIAVKQLRWAVADLLLKRLG